MITPIECARVTEAIADIDASAAWFVMVLMRRAGWSRLERDSQMIFRENPDTLLSASGNSPYQAVEKTAIKLTGSTILLAVVATGGCCHLFA